jgi:signal transduction histidine kinase
LLSNTLDLKEILQRLLLTIGRVVNCDSSAVLLIKDDAVSLVHRWPPSEWPMKQMDSIPLESLLDGMSPADAVRSEAMVFSPACKDWVRWCAIHGDPAISEVLSVPIVADDELIGLISLAANRAGLFDEHTQSVLNVFSDQAAAAIRNANLYSQAQHLAAVEERQRIARDLHDAVSQTLWSASVLVDVLPDVVNTPGADWRNVTGQLHQLIQGAQSEMRTLLWELRPESIANVELRDLLSQLSTAVICRRNLKIALDIEGQGKLPDEVVYGVYRIVQEALANVVKHANAGAVAITLRYDSEALSLRIVDDGVGFDSTQGRSGGMGFNSMTERAHGIGGEITIQAQSGHGTHVMLNWAR